MDPRETSNSTSNPSENIPRSKEVRDVQKCLMCNNHGIKSLKKHHKCLFENSEHMSACMGCNMTKQKRKVNAIEKKNAYKNTLTSEKPPGRQRRTKMCRKCRNHNINVEISKHMKDCQYKFCECEACLVVNARRKMQKTKNFETQVDGSYQSNGFERTEEFTSDVSDGNNEAVQENFQQSMNYEGIANFSEPNNLYSYEYVDCWYSDLPDIDDSFLLSDEFNDFLVQYSEGNNVDFNIYVN